MIRNKRLRINSIEAGAGISGIGFVIVPIEVDRDEYIKNCYSTSRVTIAGGHFYGVLPDVLVDKRVLQEIRFPTNVDDDLFGSPVFWVMNDYSQCPIITSIFNEDGEFFELKEAQARVYKEYRDKSVNVVYDAKNAMYSVILAGDSDTPANYNIKVISKNKGSKINIYTDNEVNIEAEKSLTAITGDEVRVTIYKDDETSAELGYKINDGLTYKDEFSNEIQANNDGVRIKSDKDIKLDADGKVIHNAGTTPMVLGNELKQLLNNLINAVSAITVTCPTSGGTSSIPINAPSIQAIAAQLDNVLSQKSKLE